MRYASVAMLLIAAALLSMFSFAAELKYPPMPPDFSAKDREEALLKYPLGVITKQAAFPHHGQAIRTVTLPNGNEGWVYQVGEGSGLRTYTLAFNEKGIVTDVLYNEKGRHNGMTALQLQAQARRILGPDAETPPFKKHAPEEYRRGK